MPWLRLKWKDILYADSHVTHSIHFLFLLTFWNGICQWFRKIHLAFSTFLPQCPSRGSKCTGVRSIIFKFKELPNAPKLLPFKILPRKTSQKSDISSKIIKENASIFAEYLRSSKNDLIKPSTFPSCLKVADTVDALYLEQPESQTFL